MGVNFYQHCVFGIAVDPTEIVLGEEIYKEEPRYDTKTGKQTHTEKILVKTKETKYEIKIGDKVIETDEPVYSPEIHEYIKQLNESAKYHYLLKCIEDQHNIYYIGFSLGEVVNYGRADLLDDTIGYSLLQNYADQLVRMLGINHDDISLHFFAESG